MAIRELSGSAASPDIYNSGNGATIFSIDPLDATNPRRVQVVLQVGQSGGDELDGTGGDFELALLIDDVPIDGGPQTKTVGAGVLELYWESEEICVPENKKLSCTVTSPNSADTQVFVEYWVYDVNAVDVQMVDNDSTAAANLLADYDGTGYAKANSTIGTCTTNTDMRGTESALTTLGANAPAGWINAAALGGDCITAAKIADDAISDEHWAVTSVVADVQFWNGTGVVVSSTTAKPQVDVYSVSDDDTAANNLKAILDGTGGTGLTLNSLNITDTSASPLVNILNSGSGAGLNIQSGGGVGLNIASSTSIALNFDGSIDVLLSGSGTIIDDSARRVVMNSDATPIDGSALATAVSAIGSDGTGLTEAGGTGDQFTALPVPRVLVR